MLLRVLGEGLDVLLRRGAGERLLDLADLPRVVRGELVEIARGLVERLLDVTALALAFALRAATTAGLAAGVRGPSALRAERGIGLAEPRREVLRRERGMREVGLLATAVDAEEVGADDLADVAAERAELAHRLPAALEHDVRRVHALLGTGLLGRLRREGGGGGHLVGDLGELVRDVARAAEAEALHRRVEHERHALARLHDVGPRGRARRAGLVVDRVAELSHAAAQHRAEPTGHAHARVARRDRRLEELAPLARALRVLVEHRATVLELGRERIAETPGEVVHDDVTHVDERGEALRLRLADVGRDDRDRLARAPLRPGDGVVVLRLDADLDRGVALLDEGIARAEAVPAAVALRLAVEPGEDAPLLVRAGAEDEMDLAEPVVVRDLVVHRDVRGVLLAREADLPGRALELDDRRQVRDRRDVRALRLGDHDVAEARDHRELHGLGERPPGDDLARSVVDERDLVRAIRQQQAAARVERRPADRDERAARERALVVRGHAALLEVQVIRRPRPQHRLAEPHHAHGRDAAPRNEHVGALERGPRRGDAPRDRRDEEPRRRDADEERDPACALADTVDRHRRERAGDVKLGEGLRRPRGRIAEERQRADRALGALRHDPTGDVTEEARGAREDAALEATCDEEHADERDEHRDGGEPARHRAAARDEQRAEKDEHEARRLQAPLRSAHREEPGVRERTKRLLVGRSNGTALLAPTLHQAERLAVRALTVPEGLAAGASAPAAATADPAATTRAAAPGSAPGRTASGSSSAACRRPRRRARGPCPRPAELERPRPSSRSGSSPAAWA